MTIVMKNKMAVLIHSPALIDSCPTITIYYYVVLHILTNTFHVIYQRYSLYLRDMTD